MSEMTKTLCPYCGVGCGLEVSPPGIPGKATNRDSSGAPVWRVRGDRDHPSSKGQVCVKGATIAEALDKNRLKYPMMRDSLDESFRRVSWDEAYDRIVREIRSTLARLGPTGICMYGSGQFQTEDYYTAQKLLKGCLGTNNFDANSRLCMSSAVAGYIQSFGSDGPPTCYDDLDKTDCAFLIGTNTAECHPIVFNRLRKHHKRNRKVKLIVVDPRRTPTAAVADLHLAIRPGTDMHLLNGMAHLLMRWGYLDTVLIDECTAGFGQFAEIIRHYPPELVSRQCGIRLDELEKAARWWGDSDRVLSLWSMGVNQSVEGTATCRTIINLHLMTGNIGKPGAGPFSLTGQPNAMGGREAGGLAHILPGYRTVKNPQHRAELETLWQVSAGSISPQPGLAAWDMIRGLEQGTVGVMWVAATNPAVSMPDLVRTKAALRQSPFTICQDAYYPTETALYSHLLLPAAQFGEKSGVMTNSERVVTYCPQFRDPPGEARADWEIFAEVGRRLGFEREFNFVNAAAVYAEFVSATKGRPCDMTRLSHRRLAEEGPTQWPSPGRPTDPIAKLAHPEPKRLYTDLRFNTSDGRANFAAFHAGGLAEPPNPDYPLVLTVGRLYEHWHTMSRTGHIARIAKKHPHPRAEIHPKDAAKFGIEDGQWLEVRSRRGTSRFLANVTKAIAPGTVFVPMHWGELWAKNSEANALTHPEVCPISLQPELKACAVRVMPATDAVEDEMQPQVAVPQLVSR
ncbi:molybdopterin oxidoreductase family protein [Synechococcus sp. PCC 7336]|uniref:molybdopterin oxidoreductase family protein n=1 Tax=Synechococcus sp. PCC 7336 TaxID=195250 RepID=UPI00034DBAAC|nr:nitrate reductase [Synechococcus sp. PCC 7336]